MSELTTKTLEVSQRLLECATELEIQSAKCFTDFPEASDMYSQWAKDIKSIAIPAPVGEVSEITSGQTP